MSASNIIPLQPPEPLPCRLDKLHQELVEAAALFKKQGNDDAAISTEAAAERLREVVEGFFNDLKIWREAGGK